MAKAEAKNITKQITDAELAKAFRDLESPLYDLQNMADICSAIVEEETKPWPLPTPLPDGFMAINDQSVARLHFCVFHLEQMISSLSKGYFAKAFPRSA